MRNSKLPIVLDDYVEDYPEIKIGSDAWFIWLNKLGASFRYEPKQLSGTSITRKSFTVVSRVRKGSGSLFWVAVKKVNNKLRQEYLGLTDELDYEKLQIACDNLSLSEVDYQKLKNKDITCLQLESDPNKNDELAELKQKYRKLKEKLLKLESKLNVKEHDKFDGIKGYRANGASGLRSEIQKIIDNLKSE